VGAGEVGFLPPSPGHRSSTEIFFSAIVGLWTFPASSGVEESRADAFICFSTNPRPWSRVILGRSSLGGPGLRKAGEGLVAGINLCTGEGDGWTGLANISTRGLAVEGDELLAGGDLGIPGLVDAVHREGVEMEGVAHGGEVIGEGDAEGFAAFETSEDEAGLDSL
jgi:hypothetical protein